MAFIRCSVCNKFYEESGECPYCSGEKSIPVKKTENQEEIETKVSVENKEETNTNIQPTKSSNGKKSTNNDSKNFALGCGGLIVFVIMVILLYSIGGNSGSSSTQSYDDFMSSQDWGKGYYYDTGTHSVEKNLYGILH